MRCRRVESGRASRAGCPWCPAAHRAGRPASARSEPDRAARPPGTRCRGPVRRWGPASRPPRTAGGRPAPRTRTVRSPRPAPGTRARRRAAAGPAAAGRRTDAAAAPYGLLALACARVAVTRGRLAGLRTVRRATAGFGALISGALSAAAIGSARAAAASTRVAMRPTIRPAPCRLLGVDQGPKRRPGGEDGERDAELVQCRGRRLARLRHGAGRDDQRAADDTAKEHAQSAMPSTSHAEESSRRASSSYRCTVDLE